MSRIRVSTKKVIVPKAPSQSVDVQYPIDWFKNHPNSKPILNISLIRKDLEAARTALRKGILDNDINLDVAKTFLYYYASTIKSKLDDDWISYKCKIGAKGDEITPLDLLQLEPLVANVELPVVSNAVPEDNGWMAGFVLSRYRLTKATVQEYKQQIAARVSIQLKAIKSSAPDVTDVVDMYKGWAGDKGYNMLVAAYDMYFNKFPLHPLSNLRIGTTGSRFRDCAALISYGYIMDLLGMPKATDVMDWVFLELIGSNIDQMMTSEDELLDDYSYFPYHVDMGLVTKSAFSATANPHFFEWVHLIGALMKAPRSLNARHISDLRALDVLANAACVAYTFSHTFAFTKVYTETGEELGDHDDEVGSDEEDDSKDNELEKILKSRDPSVWCTLIQSMDGELPDKVKKFIVRSISASCDVREGTIEEHLKRLSSVFAHK